MRSAAPPAGSQQQRNRRSQEDRVDDDWFAADLETKPRSIGRRQVLAGVVLSAAGLLVPPPTTALFRNVAITVRNIGRDSLKLEFFDQLAGKKKQWKLEEAENLRPNTGKDVRY